MTLTGMQTTTRTGKSQYSETEAAEELGITVTQLRSMIRSHVVEEDYDYWDALDDTPECPKSADANHNGQADASECPDGFNPMFWTLDFTQPQDLLSPDQRQVEFDAVIAVP